MSELSPYSIQALSLKKGDQYRHYKKGTIYTIIDIARHTETLEELVVYTDGEKTWVRPIVLFLSPATDENGQNIIRFQKLTE